MEIIGIINKYLDAIFHGKYHVESIESIRRLDVEKLKGELDFSMVDENKFMQHLEKYVKHLDDFADKLGSKVTVSESDIEGYVAQHKHDDNSVMYYTYLGVKNANIVCRFPNEDSGKIVLVDTIGLGATSLGIEDSMMDAVENDSDAIVLMFRPEAMRAHVDDIEVNIIKDVSERISAEYSKEMMFWVLNCVNGGAGENKKYISDVHDEIRKGAYPIAKVLDVDCLSPEDVQDNFLVPVLEQMAGRIGVVDELLIKRLNDAGRELYAAYHSICEAVQKVMIGAANEDVRRALEPIIKRTIDKDFLGKLKDLCNAKKSLREEVSLPFKEATDQKLKNLFISIPKEDEIQQWTSEGLSNQHNFVERGARIIRIKTIDDFMTLDDVLSELDRGLKLEVLHTLVDEDMGRMGWILPLDDNADPDEWIDKFIEKTESERRYPMVAEVLKSLKRFKLRVEGFLIYEVRNSLDDLDFALSESQPPVSPNRIVPDIMTWLEHFTEGVHNHIQERLAELGTMPNKAMFAAARDFYDRAAFTFKDDKTVEMDWHHLYEDWMSVIWADEYKGHQSMQSRAEAWEHMVSSLKESDITDLFLIR